MADAHEPLWQYVQKEAPQELASMERHNARLVAVRIVAPTKRDAFSIESQQAMIRDGDAVGVAPEIAQYLQRSAESRLGVNDPVLAAQTAEELGKLFRFAE